MTTTVDFLQVKNSCVLNRNDKSAIIGFLLSQKMTSKEVELLFSAVNTLLPDFKPAFFMSDAAEAFRNGFKKVSDSKK